jgi:hypothetical protein
MEEEITNRCIICGVNLGDCNPRQYCCKTYCPMETIEYIDLNKKINPTDKKINPTNNQITK